VDRPGAPTELFKRSGGFLLDYELTAPRKGMVAFAYPLHNMDLENSAFTSIWVSMVTGMSAMPNLKRYRLMDFTLPERALLLLPWAEVRIKGTREILGTSESDAIIGTIVKPTCGLTPDEAAAICGEAASAGIKFIKDDERMLNPSYCPLKERVKRVSEKLRQAYEETATGFYTRPISRPGRTRYSTTPGLRLTQEPTLLCCVHCGGF